MSWATDSRTARAQKENVVRVLVAEDFEVLARSIGTGLRREGMAVDVVLDESDALGHLATTRYDVVVLDRAPRACTATKSAEGSLQNVQIAAS